MTTITVDAVDVVELTEILEYLVGSLDTLVAPATIVPSDDGDAYDLNDVRTDITRLVTRLLTRPLTPPAIPRNDGDLPELIALNRGDIEDIAHILGQVEDFLLHGDDQATRHLISFLGNDTCHHALVRWIAELASHLRRRLEARNP